VDQPPRCSEPSLTTSPAPLTGYAHATCAGVLKSVMSRLRSETIIPSLDAQEASEAAAKAAAEAEEAAKAGEPRPRAVLDNCIRIPPRPLSAKLASEIGAAVERAHLTAALIAGETDSEEEEGTSSHPGSPLGRTRSGSGTSQAGALGKGVWRSGGGAASDAVSVAPSRAPLPGSRAAAPSVRGGPTLGARSAKSRPQTQHQAKSKKKKKHSGPGPVRWLDLKRAWAAAGLPRSAQRDGELVLLELQVGGWHPAFIMKAETAGAEEAAGGGTGSAAAGGGPQAGGGGAASLGAPLPGLGTSGRQRTKLAAVPEAPGSVASGQGGEEGGQQQQQQQPGSQPEGLSEWVGSDLVVLRRGEWWAAVLSDALLTQIMALRSSRRVRINWRKVCTAYYMTVN
jgi:hypothetical protein